MSWHSFTHKVRRSFEKAFIEAPLRVGSLGLADALYYQPKEQAEEQLAAQREANRQAEAVAAREAGNTPQATNQSDALSDLRKKKSAMRRAIYTASTSSGQKLGD